MRKENHLTQNLVLKICELANMAFAVEIALAKARKEDAMIQIKSKEDVLHALTETETFGKILKQGEEALWKANI
jgi:hypothetical protein